ncbi:hypothetical protein AAFF_G00309720 [Aldrovandia affinis]|uniref:Securin n=1 Tax=Aldrovandia affinis TaxID=143900 RepID=A0AAD7SP02_9TELE|nr:hypothetical protein AAFF_G00309720 [Aldrovandia affinis]
MFKTSGHNPKLKYFIRTLRVDTSRQFTKQQEVVNVIPRLLSGKMATMIYIDQENGALRTPAPSKQLGRGRLYSAPGSILADSCLKTPMTEKPRLGALQQSARRALGNVNKLLPGSSVSLTGQNKSKIPTMSKQKVDTKTPNQEEVYPEIENLTTYDPREFETYEVPEEVRLSHLSLAGLAIFSLPIVPEEEFEMLDTSLQLSPLKMPREDFSAELDYFLQTIDELTVDLPPAPEY